MKEQLSPEPGPGLIQPSHNKGLVQSLWEVVSTARSVSTAAHNWWSPMELRPSCLHSLQHRLGSVDRTRTGQLRWWQGWLEPPELLKRAVTDIWHTHNMVVCSCHCHKLQAHFHQPGSVLSLVGMAQVCRVVTLRGGPPSQEQSLFPLFLFIKHDEQSYFQCGNLHHLSLTRELCSLDLVGTSQEWISFMCEEEFPCCCSPEKAGWMIRHKRLHT